MSAKDVNPARMVKTWKDFRTAIYDTIEAQRKATGVEDDEAKEMFRYLLTTVIPDEIEYWEGEVEDERRGG